MPTRINPVRPGDSSDSEVNRLLEEQKKGWWKDTNMLGVIARRPELIKAIIPVFKSFFGTGLVEPHIHEMMRIKVGNVSNCTYCYTVRTAGVRDKVSPLEKLIIPHLESSGLSRREYLAVKLAEKMAMDPHSVDDTFWKELKEVFSDDEIVEMIFAIGIFKWGNLFNITMRMDSAPDSEYPKNLIY